MNRLPAGRCAEGFAMTSRGRGLRLVGVLFAGVFVAFAGCGKAPPAAPTTVRGTVTFQGQPFMLGLIVFAPDREKGNDGAPVSATIATDGTYTLNPEGSAAISPGWYRIALADP